MSEENLGSVSVRRVHTTSVSGVSGRLVLFRTLFHKSCLSSGICSKVRTCIQSCREPVSASAHAHRAGKHVLLFRVMGLLVRELPALRPQGSRRRRRWGCHQRGPCGLCHRRSCPGLALTSMMLIQPKDPRRSRGETHSFMPVVCSMQMLCSPFLLRPCPALQQTFYHCLCAGTETRVQRVE